MIYFFRDDFGFKDITVLNLNPDPNITKNQMFNCQPYPFGLDPVNEWKI